MCDWSDYIDYYCEDGVYFCSECESPLVPVRCRRLVGSVTRCGNWLYSCPKCMDKSSYRCGCEVNYDYDEDDLNIESAD